MTTIFGAPLIALSIQMILGSKKVKLPKKISEYEINSSSMQKISSKIIPVLEFIEKYTKPRFKFTQSVYCEQFVGVMNFIASIAITIPLPMTNAIPALGITIMAIGLLNRDGVVVLIGFIISIIGVLIAISAIVASWVILKYLFSSVFL